MAPTKKRSRCLFVSGKWLLMKERIENVSRPRLSGKVAAEPSEGASVSRHERMEISVSRYEKTIFTERY